MTDITEFTFHGTAVTIATHFQWRDRFGEFHDIENMETRHLFYTLRMIWNHTMPEAYRFEPFQRYNFAPFYTALYMKCAAANMLVEVTGRKDLTPYMERTLRRMYELAVFGYKPHTQEALSCSQLDYSQS